MDILTSRTAEVCVVAKAIDKSFDCGCNRYAILHCYIIWTCYQRDMMW